MSKLIWTVVSIIVLIVAFAIPATRSVISNLYDIIVRVNTDFFSVMPAWMNFGISVLVAALIIALARHLRD